MGGVVGGVAVLALIAVVIFRWRRSMRRGLKLTVQRDDEKRGRRYAWNYFREHLIRKGGAPRDGTATDERLDASSLRPVVCGESSAARGPDYTANYCACSSGSEVDGSQLADRSLLTPAAAPAVTRGRELSFVVHGGGRSWIVHGHDPSSNLNSADADPHSFITSRLPHPADVEQSRLNSLRRARAKEQIPQSEIDPSPLPLRVTELQTRQENPEPTQMPGVASPSSPYVPGVSLTARQAVGQSLLATCRTRQEGQTASMSVRDTLAQTARAQSVDDDDDLLGALVDEAFDLKI